jgi:hypothetical protein
MQTARLEDFIQRQIHGGFAIAQTFLSGAGAYWSLVGCWLAWRLIVFGIERRYAERWHSSCSLISFHLLHVISLQFAFDFPQVVNGL